MLRKCHHKHGHEKKISLRLSLTPSGCDHIQAEPKQKKAARVGNFLEKYNLIVRRIYGNNIVQWTKNEMVKMADEAFLQRTIVAFNSFNSVTKEKDLSFY